MCTDEATLHLPITFNPRYLPSSRKTAPLIVYYKYLSKGVLATHGQSQTCIANVVAYMSIETTLDRCASGCHSHFNCDYAD